MARLAADGDIPYRNGGTMLPSRRRREELGRGAGNERAPRFSSKAPALVSAYYQRDRCTGSIAADGARLMEAVAKLDA